jgi:hypothetical protein
LRARWLRAAVGEEEPVDVAGCDLGELRAQPRARLRGQERVHVFGLGVVAGVTAAMAAALLIQPLLFGVTPHDGLTLATAVAILVTVGLLAAFWPARRATRVNALEVLRWE